MDKACWMCNPGVSSHLNHRVHGGQGEGMEVDSTVGGGLRLLGGGEQNTMKLKPTQNSHVIRRTLNCEECRRT